MHKTARYLTALGLGLSVSAVVGWLLLKESKRGRETHSLTVKSRNREAELDDMAQIVLPLDALESSEEEGAGAGDGDDFTRIKDIGPRFAAALRAIGITSFEQLAKQTPETLADQLAQYVTIRSQRIRDKNWIGQAARLSRNSK